jgi:hypothetical protein
MTNTPKNSGNIVIEGITEDGEAFRPSDWAERVSGSLSTFENQRIHYSPFLRPSLHHDTMCVILDKSLETTNPALYKEILAFARNNKLKICGDENTADQDPAE